MYSMRYGFMVKLRISNNSISLLLIIAYVWLSCFSSFFHTCADSADSHICHIDHCSKASEFSIIGILSHSFSKDDSCVACYWSTIVKAGVFNIPIINLSTLISKYIIPHNLFVQSEIKDFAHSRAPPYQI